MNRTNRILFLISALAIAGQAALAAPPQASRWTAKGSGHTADVTVHPESGVTVSLTPGTGADGGETPKSIEITFYGKDGPPTTLELKSLATDAPAGAGPRVFSGASLGEGFARGQQSVVGLEIRIPITGRKAKALKWGKVQPRERDLP